jgi:hypothetical protein
MGRATAWFIGFACWGVVLSGACFFVTRGYRSLLGDALAGIFTSAGHPMRLAEVDVGMSNDALVFADSSYWIRATCPAPMDLALFAAMCLASARMPLKLRLRSLVAGTSLLVLAELVMLSWCVASMLADGAHGVLGFRSILTWTRIMGTFSWVGPLAVWILLVGRSEPVTQARTLGDMLAGSRRSGSG